MHDTDATTITSRRSRSAEVALWRQTVDLVVDGRILLDVRIGRGNIRFRLVIVVIADEILHRAVREKLAELGAQLRRKRLIMRNDQRRLLNPLDHAGHGEGFARTGHAQKNLIASAPRCTPRASPSMACGWSPRAVKGAFEYEFPFELFFHDLRILIKISPRQWPFPRGAPRARASGGTPARPSPRRASGRRALPREHERAFLLRFAQPGQAPAAQAHIPRARSGRSRPRRAPRHSAWAAARGFPHCAHTSRHGSKPMAKAENCIRKYGRQRRAPAVRRR